MRILFLHVAKDRTSSSEYGVHHMLAQHADPAQFDARFIWQRLPADTLLHAGAGADIYYDFGRDLTQQPRPTRAQRAHMMAARLPGGLALIAATIRAYQPQVIYTCQQKLDVRLGRLFALAYRIPHVIHLHYPLVPALGRDVLALIRRTPRLIAVSDYIRREAIQFGVHPAHIWSVPNPAPAVVTSVIGSPAALRAEFGWPPGTPVVVAAGRLDPSKGYGTLIEAFTQVHAQLPQARLLVCGASTTRDGYAQTLQAHVNALGLGQVIVFAGHRRDLPAVFAGADVFCLPTLNEAFGLVFLEAMSAGLPVVAARSGAVPDIVCEGETGLLLPPGDASGIAQALIWLLCDQQLARRLGRAGQARCRAVFAPDVVAAQWQRAMQALTPLRD
jgi:glycosyltransferase involved in cell wall biosynthesis